MKQVRQSSKRIDAADVVSLLREVYPEGIRGRNEAEALIAFDREMVDPAPEWRGFVGEAIADHLLRRSQPVGSITCEQADWLIRSIAPLGRIATPGGTQILIRTIEQAEEIPASLAVFAIRELWCEALAGAPCTLAAQDVAKLRRILVTVRGNISAEEAEALFDLHDAVASAPNHASFDDLFFRAITNYLLGASQRQTLPRRQALSREPRRDEIKNIEAEYAAWLAARIMRDGRPTFAERALLSLMEGGREPEPASRGFFHRAA